MSASSQEVSGHQSGAAEPYPGGGQRGSQWYCLLYRAKHVSSGSDFTAIKAVKLYSFNCHSSPGAATPGMMGKSVWSEHVSGSGEHIIDCLFK